ncbi:putative sugar transporter integral membrane protein [Renibacterium salmoninarum ATCC 33209]|uniref:Putative sugar transporter integral membrane protein n=1 Tax=Renibacterium salmoninarum (strain ATCC 33209 / DSM 20767 / JCM 11484 / NBRC 15589 / NCIMB 2235) TaxID=288705 RepID=A9WTI1_RENSM|nr:sugar ABC transporter permease [Renibacterium salmoninarum]ABY24502.1 putative sugar transporter integral membrane protein [Renibacterium salmoninarum ATCC 33209]
MSLRSAERRKIRQLVPQQLHQRKRSKLPLLLLLPAVATVALAMGYPLVRQVIMAFQQFSLAQQFGAEPEFIWFGNFITVLTDSAFWLVLARSLLFCLVCATVTMLVGVGGAVLLTKLSRPVSVLVQSVMLLAWALPVLSSLQVFQRIFDARSGVVDWVLTKLGFSGMENFNWFSNPLTFFIMAGLLVIWMSVPLVLFMVYASITQIDESMLEASTIDGANGWKQFREITVPTIAPVLLLVGILQVIWDLRVFTQIYILQKSSGITDQTNVLGTYIYQVGLAGGDYGVASATALIMLLIPLLLTWRYVRLVIKQGDL